jgi:precorrin-4/cobalt-precorrin-4 C11-methyltransferase
MTVHFIGAGPGAPDLLTLRGRDLIAYCELVLYAGSLVPPAVVAHAHAGAKVTDTADMTLDQIIDAMALAHEAGHNIARVHSGDPSLYGAIGEQIRRLNALGIDYDITPGVPAYAAVAASIGKELTLPDVSQTVVLTRTAMRSSAMPNREDLETLALSGATLAIHLSARNTREVEESLIPHYGADCPTVIAVRASWPDEEIFHCRLDELHRTVKDQRIRRTALILVGQVLGHTDYSDSKLYDAKHFHLLRPKKKREK